MTELDEKQLNTVAGGTSNHREKTIRVPVDLSKGHFEGDVIIKPYLDGELQTSQIKTVDAIIQSVVNIDIKGVNHPLTKD